MIIYLHCILPRERERELEGDGDREQAKEWCNTQDKMFKERLKHHLILIFRGAK